MPVNLNQYRGTVGTFNNRNYYHKSTLSLGRPCQNTFFLDCAFPFSNISLLFVLLITVFLTLKSNSYRSTKHFHTLSFLVTIITIWSLPWLHGLLILLSADVELKPGPFLIVLIGDLNTKSKNWYSHDKNRQEGNKIENVTAQFNLQQIMKEPTHISNTSTSCIDLTW